MISIEQRYAEIGREALATIQLGHARNLVATFWERISSRNKPKTVGATVWLEKLGSTYY